MLSVLLFVLVACAVAALFRGMRFVAVSILVGLTSLIGWWFALMFQLIPLDRILGTGVNATVGAAIFFGPPVIVTVIAMSAWRALRRDRG